jgi:hypothetical protein
VLARQTSRTGCAGQAEAVPAEADWVVWAAAWERRRVAGRREKRILNALKARAGPRSVRVYENRYQCRGRGAWLENRNLCRWRKSLGKEKATWFI